MERPQYDESIARQNDVYAMEVIERYRDKPKTASELMAALTDAFILGAGGYEGSFDAALVLEYGGMEVLLKKLGLEDMDRDMSAVVDKEVFEHVVRAAVDYGAAWDELEDEIPTHSISDTDIMGEPPFLGPLSRKYVTRFDQLDGVD